MNSEDVFFSVQAADSKRGRYGSFDEALARAEATAKRKPGETFVVMQVVAGVTNHVNIERMSVPPTAPPAADGPPDDDGPEGDDESDGSEEEGYERIPF